ncbi:hypothetical protein AB0K02_19975 [Streptomyces sp. NPDC049597]
MHRIRSLCVAAALALEASARLAAPAAAGGETSGTRTGPGAERAVRG